MQSIDQIVLALAAQRSAKTTVIVCLYTGVVAPAQCEPMLRAPAPEIGMPFSQEFPALLKRATGKNHAVHDGAVMVGRARPTEPYLVAGWSYRLFPNTAVSGEHANRGSAFNSCLAMSFVSGVDGVYLVSESGIFRFQRGAVEELAVPL
jgi:hypothetical protein